MITEALLELDSPQQSTLPAHPHGHHNHHSQAHHPHHHGREISYVEQYLTPLKSYLTNERVNELVINPNGSIFVEMAGADFMQQIDVSLPAQAIKRLGAQLAGETRNTLGALSPIVSGRVTVWGNSQRVQIVADPAIEHGISLSIRKYLKKAMASQDISFVEGKQIRVEEERRQHHATMAAMAEAGDLQGLFHQAIEERLNILISGGTSSGKTTVARSLLEMVDIRERLITIEDAPELFAPHRNQVSLISERKEKSARTPSKLLESCLRMRPDRIIVGEIRGTEAYDFLEAINTGHPGAVTTIHADSPALAFDRLALMVMRAGMRLSHAEIIGYAKRTIDLVVQVGRRNGKRGVLEIYLPSQEDR